MNFLVQQINGQTVHDFDTKADMETVSRMIQNHENAMRIQIKTFVDDEVKQAELKSSLEKRIETLTDGIHIYSPEEFNYVDLGLPSETLWSTTNADVQGGCCPYSLAKFLFPGMLPTKKQFIELVKECTWKPQLTSKGKLVEYRVVGKNGNSIVLPATGYYDRSEKKFFGIVEKLDGEENIVERYGHGHYISSTEDGFDGAVSLHFSEGTINPIRTMSQVLYLAVRPVMNKQS